MIREPTKPTIEDLIESVEFLEIRIKKMGVIITDHSQLSGLGDDDHSQYHNNARGDARYYTETELDAGQLDNRYYTETELDAGQLDNRYYTEAEVDALVTEIGKPKHPFTAGENLVAAKAVGVYLEERPIASNDSYVFETNPDENNGNADDFYVGKTEGDKYHSLINFDLSAVPDIAYATGAILYVYLNSIENVADDMDIHQITESWTEGAVTWNNKPAFNAGVVDTITPADVGWYNADMSSIVLSGAWNTYGFYLELDRVADSASRMVAINSSEDAVNKPYLLFYYQDGKVYKVNARTAAQANGFVGFADSTVPSGTSGDMRVGGVVGGFSGLTIGTIYYLSDTDGEISTSAGSVTKKVGMAVSTTELLMLNS